MSSVVLLDTGPLVAYLNKSDKYHSWSQDYFHQQSSPFMTCQSVIAEACYLLRNTPHARENILELVHRRLLITEFNLNAEAAHIKKLLVKYSDVPMSLADACLVRMCEIYQKTRIFTLDSDFSVYRKNKNQSIQTITPFDA